MDINTIIVAVINGGLVLFFLYALFTSQRSVRDIKRDPGISTKEPILELERSSDEEFEQPESIAQEVHEPEPEYEPTPEEYEPEPEYEPTPEEYETEYEPEPEYEPTPEEYEPTPE